jgi:cytochrome c oxidase subunit 4
MSTHVDQPAGETHPSTRVYAVVFFILALMTTVELALSLNYFVVPQDLLTPLFLAGALIKASLVAAFYMHLKYDTKFYTYIFVIPVLLLIVFAITATIS